MKGLTSVLSEPRCWVSGSSKILQRMTHLFNFINNDLYWVLLLTYLYSHSSCFLIYSFIIVQSIHLSTNEIFIQKLNTASSNMYLWISEISITSLLCVTLLSLHPAYVLMRKTEAFCFFCGASLPGKPALITIKKGICLYVLLNVSLKQLPRFLFST